MKRCLALQAMLLVAHGAIGKQGSITSLSRAIIRTSLAKPVQGDDAAGLEKYYIAIHKNRGKVDLSSLESLNFDFIDQQALRKVFLGALQQCAQHDEAMEYMNSYKDRVRQALLYGIGSMLCRNQKVVECMTAKICCAYGISDVSYKVLDRSVFFEGVAYALHLVFEHTSNDFLLANQPEGQEIITLLSHTAWAIKYVSSLEEKSFAPEASAQLVMSIFDELCDLIV